ncbi:hypothetical protein B0H16DRAFT_1724792 [Mycena metata]|uniref:Uncharacterized protein n=1 Tax=Mycena metata TaxID=1033252 RepID=A0AAD7ISY8_9AGAR|nr:hypothetical protein B0H16DRAFT_1724792 [Mycena metata]
MKRPVNAYEERRCNADLPRLFPSEHPSVLVGVICSFKRSISADICSCCPSPFKVDSASLFFETFTKQTSHEDAKPSSQLNGAGAGDSEKAEGSTTAPVTPSPPYAATSATGVLPPYPDVGERYRGIVQLINAQAEKQPQPPHVCWFVRAVTKIREIFKKGPRLEEYELEHLSE